MAQSFDETAHLKTDMKAYHEGWERIFGSNKPYKAEPMINSEYMTMAGACYACEPVAELNIKLESQLQIAMSALNKIYDTDRTTEDMERTASRALSDIEGVD